MLNCRSNITTPKARYITRKAERGLLNERVRNINNTIAMATTERDICMNTLLGIFSKEIMEDCKKLINLRREAYYIKVKNRQKAKLERLCQRNRGGHPNIKDGGHGRQDLTDTNLPSRNNLCDRGNKESDIETDTRKRWVVHLPGQPLTEAKYKVLTHGPNFAITSRSPLP